MTKLILFFIALITIFFHTEIFAQDIIISNTFDLGTQQKSTLRAAPIVTEKTMAKNRKIAAQNTKEIFHDTRDIVIGNVNGALTFVAFVDFRCPITESMDPLIQNLIAKNPDLRVVYKQYPIHGDTSIYAAKAALAANKQEKYLPFHIALMQAGKNLSLSPKKILALAKTFNIDIEKLQMDMKDASITAQIEETKKLGRKIGVAGTPGLLFAKTNIAPIANADELIFMMGKFNQNDLQKAIDYVRR